MNPGQAILAAFGDTVRLVTEVRDQNGQVMAGVAIAWSSSDASVAAIDESGLVTAAGNGVATLSARAGSAAAAAVVTVRQLPAEVAVAPESLTFRSPGDTAMVTATVTDANGHAIEAPEVVWVSADPSVAGVDADGLVTAMSPGSTEVTATSGGVAAGVVVTVESRSSISIQPAALRFAALGDTARLTARDSTGHPIETARVLWTSRDSLVATVGPGGLVKATGNGGTTIWATSGADSAAAHVTVEQIPAGITIAPRSVTLVVGDTATLEATVADANGHRVAGAGVTWSSANSSVATVGSTGRVVGVGPGSTEVTAVRDSLSASVDVVTVESRSSISIQPAALRFAALGDTARLTARDSTGHPIETARVLWTSRDSLVATVGPGGLVKATGNGGTTIWATSGADSAAAHVTVEQIPAGITIAPRSVTLVVGDTATLEATVADANGHRVAGAGVTWSSANSSVATVGSTGRVVGVGPGSTEVTAVRDSLSASVDVEVVARSSDREVLEHLYRATGGDDWTDNTNWMTAAPLSEWAGVSADRNGRVENLLLRGNNLNGTIPASIWKLDQLFSLDLSENALHGAIPPELGRLKRLRDLILGYTDISGPLPPEMGDMTGLRLVAVDQTNLSGPLPETFAQLGLEAFWFSRTGLCLPSALSAWYEGIQSRADDPQTCIPATSDREVLVALYNATGGADWEKRDWWLSDLGINIWIGVETNAEGYVTSLFLPANNLAGPLPPELGNLPQLEVLGLNLNDLSGRIPPELGRLTKLHHLSLSSNRLEGSIPPELGNLVNVDTLYLSGNQLSGPIPPELGNMAALRRMALFENRLSGPLPPEMGKLKNLNYLWLSDNVIEGPLPPELGDMVSLQNLGLGRNQVSGPIPVELGRLGSLKRLNLSDNQIEGPIPATLGNLTSLETLNLSNNRMTGAIPRELGNLSNLEYLGLFENALSGAIPGELGNLEKLGSLELGDNQLTGAIPLELAGLPAVEAILLTRNNLSGPIPPELAGLSSLTTLAARGKSRDVSRRC